MEEQRGQTESFAEATPATSSKTPAGAPRLGRFLLLLFSFTFNLKQNVLYFILVFKIYIYLFYMHVYF